MPSWFSSDLAKSEWREGVLVLEQGQEPFEPFGVFRQHGPVRDATELILESKSERSSPGSHQQQHIW
jgi:hypothetical protein